MLTIERIDSFYGMQALQETWATLLDGCGYRNLFLSHDWAVTWWKHFGRGRNLYLLLVLDGARTVGIAPMMISKTFHRGIPLRRMEFLTNKHTSRADFILPEQAEACIQAIVSYWEAHADSWDMILLQDVVHESGSFSLLKDALNISSLNWFETQSAQPLGRLPLIGSWDDYLKSRSMNFRKTVRRRQKQINAIGEVQYTRLSGPDTVDEAMNQLFDLESRSWKAGVQGVALNEEDKAFHRSLAGVFAANHQDETRFVELDGKVIGAMHSLIYHGTLYAFLIYHDGQYDHVRPGWAVLRNLIQESFSSGYITEIDFNGMGHLAERWTDRPRERGLMQVYNARPYSRLLKTMKRLRGLVGLVGRQTERAWALGNE